ncbi:hypothetical protein Glove_213g182 [Diversispora epigaea]|uniref:RNase H type-1 domain-containing protein n=1 Tax=Diversispora epigaea TaxID=1348612 RepID=A0A397IKP5_9GLOM|nr:hypothetical protein Glove_213g182 [Diversispora epigaea]
MDKPTSKSFQFRNILIMRIMRITRKIDEIGGPPSSTRPELWAILVIDLIPVNSRVKIFMDSLSAITTIKAISDKYNSKRSTIDLIKITAHSGILLNERADELAKKGDLIKINPSFLQRNINFTWNNSTIDTNIKNFTKQERLTEWYANWWTQHRVFKWCNHNIGKDTNWKMTAKLLHNIKVTSRFTNKQDISDRTFNKDTLHPFECNNCNSFLRTKVIEKIGWEGKAHECKKEKSHIVKIFGKENFLKINVGRQVRDTEAIKKIQSNVYSFLRNLMKQKWIEHRENFVKWEKTKGINNTDERNNKNNNNNSKQTKKRIIPNEEYKRIKQNLITTGNRQQHPFIVIFLT